VDAQDLRCRLCATKHAANRAEHARQAELQTEREQAALARMWAATKQEGALAEKRLAQDLLPMGEG